MYDDLSLDELKEVNESLVLEYEDNYTKRLKLENENWFELKKYFANLVAIGARDFRQALTWDMDAYNVDGDFNFYCYLKNISYSKSEALQRLAA